MRIFITGVFVLLLTFPLKAQSLSDIESGVQSVFSRIRSETADSRRLEMNDSIHALIRAYAAHDAVFKYNLEGSRYLGQITSPDSTLKIISWNLNLSKYTGKYFTFIIRKGIESEKNKIYSLQASYDKAPFTDTTYSESDWYGALYYSVKPYIDRGGKCWVVLGLGYGDPTVARKLIDVISFDERDSLVFGKKWFETTSGMKFRRVFEYASSGMMTLRFSSDTSIVFDHLVPIPSETYANRVYYGPDYSYDAYIFTDGIWKFRLNVDARNK